ncbi:Uncharacterized protein TCM_025469 [Theobroma cacao]|uniref:DUF4283 domain-containing protein n=1 Tax=Theobroma cacao TaxID=3641 RepID=A0A061F086_THECC|nr:Uncharacterized protein TCM_025469 [Theobroma cacao]
MVKLEEDKRNKAKMEELKKGIEDMAQGKEVVGNEIRRPNCQTGTRMITIKTNVAEEDMSWVQSSAVGRLRERVDYRTVQSGLAREGIVVQIRIPEGMTVLVTLDLKEEIEVRLWVRLGEVLIHSWHMNTFKAIVGCWGEFLAIDRNTCRSERFDQANILVKVRSRAIIPSQVRIEVEGRQYSICVSMVEWEASCDLKAYTKGKEIIENDEEIHREIGSDDGGGGEEKVTTVERKQEAKCCKLIYQDNLL